LLEHRIIPRLGALPVTAVTKSDVIAFHATMANTPRRANYTISTTRALFTFAEEIGLRPQAQTCQKNQDVSPRCPRTVSPRLQIATTQGSNISTIFGDKQIWRHDGATGL
jgi:hypothetical protein